MPGAGSIPGGNHPPLKHVPPPSTTNGSGVLHEPGDDCVGDEGTGDGGVGDESAVPPGIG